MSSNYLLIEDLSKETGDIPSDSIVSRSLYSDERVKVVLFGFAPGQELSEHTASMPALLHILEGEASLALGVDSFQARAGTWVHMPAQLPHSLTAKTRVSMLLVLLKR